MHDLFKYLVIGWLFVDGLSVVGAIGKHRHVVTPTIAVCVIGGFIVMILGIQIYL